MSKLIHAAISGDVVEVMKLLEWSGNRDRDGRTALMHAAEHGHVDCVRILASKEVRLSDKRGRTALMYAAKNGHAAVVDILREMEHRMQDKDGWTALMSATKNGHLECIRLLLDEAKIMTTKKVDDIQEHFTVLIIAIYFKNIEAAIILLTHEKDLQYQKKRDVFRHINKVMKKSSNDKELAQIKVLYEILNTPASDIEPTLKKNVKFEELIRPSVPVGSVPEEPAYSTSEIETIQHDEEIKDQTERPTRTRLMVAAYNGRVDVVKKYVQQQAGKQDYRGLTALMYAMAAGHLDCVKVLAPYEAHIQMPDGWTALKEALNRDNEEVVKIILESGREIRDEVSEIAEIVCRDQKYSQMLRDWLKEHGARGTNNG